MEPEQWIICRFGPFTPVPGKWESRDTRMKAQVVYFSRSGNTKALAEAMASELEIKAENVADAGLKEGGLLFLGSGCYGGKPAKQIIEFIDRSELDSREVALFGTSGGGAGREVIEMEELLKSKGSRVKGKFFCKGRIFIFNLGRPSSEDLYAAKEFAKKMTR